MSQPNEVELVVTAKLPMNVTTLAKVQRALSQHWPDAVVKTDGPDPSVLTIVLRGEPVDVDDADDPEGRSVEAWYALERAKPTVRLGDPSGPEGNAVEIYSSLSAAITLCDDLDEARAHDLQALLRRDVFFKVSYEELLAFVRRFFTWEDDPAGIPA